MAVKDLAEGMTQSEILVSVWYDDETNEVLLQYGYVNLSMPLEDFGDLIHMLLEAEEKLNEADYGG